jgi:hypothetical protein
MGRRKSKQMYSLSSLPPSLTIHSFADSVKVPASEKLPKSLSSRSLTKVTSADAVIEAESDLVTNVKKNFFVIDAAAKIGHCANPQQAFSV